MGEAFWQSTEQLGAWTSRLNWIMGICGVIIAVASIFSLVFGSRKEKLEKIQQEQERAAQKEDIAAVKAAAQDRHLPADFAAALPERLRAMGKLNVKVSAELNNAEAIGLANEMAEAMRAAGWAVAFAPGVVFQAPFKGVEIGVAGEKPTDFALQFAALLQGANIGHHIRLKGSTPDLDLHVKVGSKP